MNISNRQSKLPLYWHGVDTFNLPGKVCELDWDEVFKVSAATGLTDGCSLYDLFLDKAEEARLKGDLVECSKLASHGLACLNYL